MATKRTNGHVRLLASVSDAVVAAMKGGIQNLPRSAYRPYILGFLSCLFLQLGHQMVMHSIKVDPILT